jgi:5-methylcytosine-specific restriction endonuclease McrA
MLARAHARRADKLGLGDLKITIAYLVQRDKGRCGICRKPVRAKQGPRRASLDHIIPLSRGGTHTLANVQLAHYVCNLSKNNRGGGEQLLLVG